MSDLGLNSDDVLIKLGTSQEIIEFATTPGRAFILLAQLQIALRHPENVGSSVHVAREIANHLADAICSKVPEARELIEQGWNPAYDVSRDYYASEFPFPNVSAEELDLHEGDIEDLGYSKCPYCDEFSGRPLISGYNYCRICDSRW